MSSRGRREGERARLELECEEHPVTCGCDSCGRLLELLGGQDDPDSMEDEEKPYWWNR